MAPLRVGAMQLIAVLTRTETGLRSEAVIPGGFMPLRDADTDDNPVATLTVTMSAPGSRGSSVTVQGPGVAGLTAPATAKLPGLLLGDADTRAVSPTPAWPLVWRLVLTTDPKRQVSVYTDRPGFRVGLLDAENGDCALLVVTRRGRDWTVDSIEGYGDHAALTGELVACVEAARTGPAKSLQDIQVTVTCDRDSAVASPDADRTDHEVNIGWADA